MIKTSQLTVKSTALNTLNIGYSANRAKQFPAESEDEEFSSGDLDENYALASDRKRSQSGSINQSSERVPKKAHKNAMNLRIIKQQSSDKRVNRDSRMHIVAQTNNLLSSRLLTEANDLYKRSMIQNTKSSLILKQSLNSRNSGQIPNQRFGESFTIQNPSKHLASNFHKLSYINSTNPSYIANLKYQGSPKNSSQMQKNQSMKSLGSLKRNMMLTSRSQDKEGQSKIMKIVRARMQQEQLLQKIKDKAQATEKTHPKQPQICSKTGFGVQQKTPQKVVHDSALYASISDGGGSEYKFNHSISGVSKSYKKGKQGNQELSVTQRLFEDEQKRREKKRNQEQQKKERELMEDMQNSFRPDIRMSSKKKHKSRKFNEFYQEQIKFKSQLDSKLQKQREEEEYRDYITGKSAHIKANKSSLLILARYQNSQEREGTPEVHQRLYKGIPLVPASMKKSQEKPWYDQSPNLKSSINMKDQKQTVDRLHSENKQRDAKFKTLQMKWEDKIPYVSPTNKEHNNKIVLEKLKQDFNAFFNKDMFYASLQSSEVSDKITKFKQVFTSKQIEFEVTPSSNKNTHELMMKGTPIKLKNFIKLMHSLGFIHITNRSAVEEEQLTEVWKQVGGTNDNQVKAENLFMFLAGILNIQLQELVQSNSNHSDHQKVGILCYDECSNAHFTSYDDITRVHQKYMQFAANRKQRKRGDSQYSTDNQFSFTPKIDIKSKSLAENKFKETLNQMKHCEYLQECARSNINMKQKLKETIIQQQMEECTFKPKLSSSNKSSKHNKSSKQESMASSIVSYGNQTPKLKLGSVSNKEPRQKSNSHYTQRSNDLEGFASSINNSKMDDSIKDNKQLTSRQSRKEIISKANQNLPLNLTKQYLNDSRERQADNTSSIDAKSRMPKSEDFDKESNKSFGSIHSKASQYRKEKKLPLLFIDVNLGKDKGLQRIIIYDDDKPQIIAEKFCLNHGLNESKEKKLEDMISQKMKEHREKIRDKQQ